jgi:DNA-directed RNA polymerase subunit RPC12/RpoP
MNCLHCQTELPENYGGTSCPSCGHDILTQSESKSPNVTRQDKSVYWGIFWITFFGAPILCLLAGLAHAGSGFLFLPILGAIVAGFSLAKIFTKTPAAFVVSGILFAIGVLVIYVGIIFVGCLVALGHGGGI